MLEEVLGHDKNFWCEFRPYKNFGHEIGLGLKLFVMLDPRILGLNLGFKKVWISALKAMNGSWFLGQKS
jgi:hypothetical protein